MKRMTKSGIFTTAAVLVILSAMLVTGCSDTIVEKPSGYTPPAGMGAVRLKFSEHIERATILPDDATILSFVEFEFTFTPNSGGVFKEEQRTSATREDPIILAPGTYDLAVIAYLPPESSAPPGDPNRAAAVWSSPTPVPVTVGINSPISITLKPYDSVVATENGTFAWEIDNQINIPITSFTVAKMTVKNLFGIPIPSATASWNPVTFNLADPTWSGAGSIPSGFYYVDIELEIDGTMKYFRHVLHIYQNMTSTFTETFDGSFFFVTVTGIVITTPPTKTTYLLGQTFKSAGLEVYAELDNGVHEDITAIYGLDTTDYDSSKTSARTYDINITYGDLSTPYPVHVIDTLTVNSAADSGAGSLREAIDDINVSDVTSGCKIVIDNSVNTIELG
ncbi:MAG: bacterial Ig-like domain-containing protein, partial [Treponema sp.]|nr:bacterial Ig-like domain-containing protein [Treponema sp.]